MSDALGMIETKGFVGAIEASDAAAKTAGVQLTGLHRMPPGLVTVILRGDVASVRVAVDAGADAARRVGELVAAHVIAKPEDGVETILPSLPDRPGPAKKKS